MQVNNDFGIAISTKFFRKQLENKNPCNIIF